MPGGARPPPRRRIALPGSLARLFPPPRFKYRGFFINDEDLLTGWAPAPKSEHTGISLAVMNKIYETILRLKGNMVVPGTWIFPDDPRIKLAGERGNDARLGMLISKAIAAEMRIVRAVHPHAQFVTDFWQEGARLEHEGDLKIPRGVIRVWADRGYGIPQDHGDLAPGEGMYYHVAMINGSANHLTEMVPVRRIYAQLGRYIMEALVPRGVAGRDPPHPQTGARCHPLPARPYDDTATAVSRQRLAGLLPHPAVRGESHGPRALRAA